MDLFIWIPIIFMLCACLIGTLTDLDNAVSLQMIGFVLMLVLPSVGLLLKYM
jgi:hypothetical protein